jgi:8-oxo-dGTP pyrophosphatase MutT (NUDIX family)
MVRMGYRMAYLGLRAWWFVRRPHTHGACVALWHKGQVLMVRSSYRDSYSLPGGFVRPHEPSEHAARRELMEELGIDLTGQGLRLARSETTVFEFHRDSIDIWEGSVTQVPDLRISGREIVWAGWMSPADLLKVQVLPHMAPYLTQPRSQEP